VVPFDTEEPQAQVPETTIATWEASPDEEMQKARRKARGWGVPKMKVPNNGWFMMENPTING